MSSFALDGADHDDGRPSSEAARYMAARDLFEALRADPRLAPVQIAEGRCNVCQQENDGSFLRVGGRVQVHARCLGQHRAAVAEIIDRLVTSALDADRAASA